MVPQPSPGFFLSCCSKERRVAMVLCLHAYAVRMGLEAHALLGNSFVSLLAEVGLLYIAVHLFDGLTFRSELSWNSLIQSFHEHGDSTVALSLYKRMCDGGMCPQAHTFVALLQSCAKLKDIQTGFRIHAHVAKTGLLQRDLFVGSALIDTYGKCGLLEQARKLFNGLLFKNTVTWNSLISMYVQHEHVEDALHCFEQMHCDGVNPDAVTFTCILKACASIGAIDKANEIHEEIDRKGFLKTNHFMGSVLVDMYAKCGYLGKAQSIFDRLPVHNVVTWTALIAGYVQHECGEEALSCFEQMQIQGVYPNAVTYSTSLKACSIIGLLYNGIGIHSDLARKQKEITNICVGNALVDMYARCGSLLKAREVFDRLPIKNLVTWNTLITAHVQQEQGEEALELFEKMQLQGIPPDAITVCGVLKACGCIGDIDKGSELHSELDKISLLNTDSSVGNALVDMYARCGSFAKAQQVFDTLPARNISTWNSLIMGFVQHEQFEEGLKCFDRMRCDGVLPDAATFACMLKACGNTGAIDVGKRIHDEANEGGVLARDCFVGSALIDMYAKLGLLSEAHKVFDRLPSQDVVTWTALIAGYAQEGKGDEALKCLDDMKSRGVTPNAHTFACSLKACGSIGALDKGEDIHQEIQEIESLRKNLVVGSALVDMYAKCGWLTKAQEIFVTLFIQNKVTWNALITGYAQWGELKNVLCLFDEMQTQGISPDLTTFLSVLNACSHSGFVDMGHACLWAMIEDYSLIPTSYHLTCMIDLLGRAGQLDRALAMLRNMPCFFDGAMWLAVLGSCRKWGDVEIGRQVFNHAMQLNEKEASACVCMFNIYVDSDMQEDI